ncbi:hypothetical protein ABK040_002509 [Willaertia magna]
MSESREDLRSSSNLSTLTATPELKSTTPELKEGNSPSPQRRKLTRENSKTFHKIRQIESRNNLFVQVELEKKDWKDAKKTLLKRGEIRTGYDIKLLAFLAKRLKLFSQELHSLITDEHIEIAMRYATYGVYELNQTIEEIDALKQTPKPSHFYILISGSVSLMGIPHNTNFLTKLGMKRSVIEGSPTTPLKTPRSNLNSKIMKTYFNGDYFGEVNVCDALLKEGTWRWIANEETEVVKIPYEKYEMTFGKILEKQLQERVDFMRNLIVPIFSGYPDAQLFELCKSINVEFIPSRKVIVTEGKEGDTMYFIKSGECSVIKAMKFTEHQSVGSSKKIDYVRFIELARLKPKEYFGERVLIYDDSFDDNNLDSQRSFQNTVARAVSVYAASETVLFSISRKTFANCKFFLSHYVINVVLNDSYK